MTDGMKLLCGVLGSCVLLAVVGYFAILNGLASENVAPPEDNADLLAAHARQAGHPIYWLGSEFALLNTTDSDLNALRVGQLVPIPSDPSHPYGVSVVTIYGARPAWLDRARIVYTRRVGGGERVVVTVAGRGPTDPRLREEVASHLRIYHP
jgi:hypothetical protein